MSRCKIVVTLITALLLVACGGGGSESSNQNPTRATGTVGLLFTDLPTDEFSEINLNVVSAVLIGGDSQQTLFSGSKAIDLLNLTNYNDAVIFGEVAAGTYTKLRLNIDALQLVPNDGSDPIYPALPANGKIDLLDASGFEILPGRTILIEIDMDANKSIKITGAGNGRKYNFRPVVRVNIMNGGLPDKLARVEGVVSQIPATPEGSFVLCANEMPTNCIDVSTGGGTSVFDNQGLATNFGTLMVNDPVVVIGRYAIEPNIVLNALVLEIGGSAAQVSGNVVSAPADDKFLVVTNDNGDFVVELQPGTKYFDATGEISVAAIVLGADVEVEGVLPAKADPADPDLIRAALVFVEAASDEQLSGVIIDPLDKDAGTFGLTPTAGGDTCVRAAAATVLLVNTAASEVTTGTLADLAVGQMVDLFGTTSIVDSCFDANEVIVELAATP